MTVPTGAPESTNGSLLPYTPRVGNQVVAEQKTAASAATRQAQQSVQLTDFTWIEQTTGEGVGAFTVLFDVAFTAEPVVAHGMTLPDFAAEIRSDVDAATTKANEAQAAADAYTYTFPAGVTVSVFRPPAASTMATGTSPYTFTTSGITNSTSNGKKVTLVVTHPDGTTSAAVLTDSGGTVPITVPVDSSETWQLLADGQPLSASSGPSTGTSHSVVVLTQDVIEARKKASTAVTDVGNVLALGGDAAAFPLCNVFVKRWLMDVQNNYIGAECIVVVKTFKAAEVTPEPSLPPIGSEPTAS